MQMQISRTLAPLACIAFAISSGPAQAVPASPQAAVNELLNADRQFSADAAGHNLIDGIAAMLAPDLIAPLASGTFARNKEEFVASLRANPANATRTAEWAPVRGGISADGLQGFTYGFQTIHSPGQPDLRAKYLAYWVKRSEGWRVFTYKRFGSPPGTVSTAIRPAALPPVMLPRRPSEQLVSDYRASLASRESAFSDRAHDVGLRQAFVEFGSADAMNMTTGSSDFVYGNVAIASGQPTTVPSPVMWAADVHVQVASTGDLGVTFGYIRPTDSLVTIPFFTIWRRARTSSPWLYVAE